MPPLRQLFMTSASLRQALHHFYPSPPQSVSQSEGRRTLHRPHNPLLFITTHRSSRTCALARSPSPRRLNHDDSTPTAQPRRLNHRCGATRRGLTHLTSVCSRCSATPRVSSQVKRVTVGLQPPAVSLPLTARPLLPPCLQQQQQRLRQRRQRLQKPLLRPRPKCRQS